MQWNLPTRFAIAFALCLLFLQPDIAAAQVGTSHHKPSVPRSLAPPSQMEPVVTVPVPPPTPAQQPPQRAEVTYQHGELKVAADNSSLNQILREIGRETGIKITGGVADERVFGTYGPSSASEVLASLLDGTEANMMLIQSDATSPGELILTPRHGGASPPNPNAPGFDDEGAADTPPPSPSPPQPPATFTPPATEQPTPMPAATVAPATNQPSSTPADNDAADPNAVKTPQQIFQQLQKLRQQQQLQK